MTRDEAHEVIRLALGRIFLLGSRPARPGDIEQYESARRAALDAAEELGCGPGYQHRHTATVLVRHNSRFGD